MRFFIGSTKAAGGPAGPSCYTPGRMLASLTALWRYRDLVRNLVARDLRVKYKGSSVGFAWSLLHPLIMAAVYTVAFRYVLAVKIDRFPLFLLSGLLPWMFFAGALAQATGSVADNGTLLRKVGRLLDDERAHYAERRYELTETAASILLGGFA